MPVCYEHDISRARLAMHVVDLERSISLIKSSKRSVTCCADLHHTPIYVSRKFFVKCSLSDDIISTLTPHPAIYPNGLSQYQGHALSSEPVSTVTIPSYSPYPHSASRSVVDISFSDDSIGDEKSSSCVFCALFLGLTYTCAMREGSMSFPGPTRTRPEFLTWVTPCGVSSSSLMPVYWPDFVHSVSPTQQEEARVSRARSIMTRISQEGDLPCRAINTRGVPRPYRA